MTAIAPSATLDTSGKCCPMPMVETNRKIRELDAGEILQIIATDPATATDIPSWCQRTGHQLIGQEKHDGTYTYLVKKA